MSKRAAWILEPLPIEIKFRPDLKPDGRLVRVAIRQEQAEIQLTAEQVRSLVLELTRRFP